MNHISIGQAARAMKLEEPELYTILECCGISTEAGWLEADDITALEQYLEERRDEALRQSQSKLERLTEQLEEMRRRLQEDVPAAR